MGRADRARTYRLVSCIEAGQQAARGGAPGFVLNRATLLVSNAATRFRLAPWFRYTPDGPRALRPLGPLSSLQGGFEIGPTHRAGDRCNPRRAAHKNL